MLKTRFGILYGIWSIDGRRSTEKTNDIVVNKYMVCNRAGFKENKPVVCDRKVVKYVDEELFLKGVVILQR